VTSALLAERAAAEVLLELRFGRWHARADCPVIRAQPEAFVQPAYDPAETRPCTICALSAATTASQ
jgi:hypothetical protein